MTTRSYRFVALAVAGLIALAALIIPAATTAQAGSRFFPQTGHTVSEPFLSYWSEHGGLAIFGYPISDLQPYTDPASGQALQAQWFERARFELHPENPAPWNVELGRLGAELYQPQAQPRPGFDPSGAQILIDDSNFTARISPNQTAALGADERALTVTVRFARSLSGQRPKIQLQQLDLPSDQQWQVAPAGRADTADSYSFALRGAAASPDYLRVEVTVGEGNPALFFGIQLTDKLPGSPILQADWSADGLIASYYNAINRGEYARAYSYWEQPGRPNSAPADFATFAQGYSNTASVDVSTGAHSSDAGAGNLYTAVPTVLHVTLKQPQNGSLSQRYFGCYLLHGVNAPVDNTVPPYPLQIRSADMRPAPADADPAELMRQATDLAQGGQCG